VYIFFIDKRLRVVSENISATGVRLLTRGNKIETTDVAVFESTLLLICLSHIIST